MGWGLSLLFMLSFASGALAATPVSPPVIERFLVELDCYLPMGNVTCTDLARDLSSSVTGLEIVTSGAPSTVRVKIRAIELDQNYQYFFEFRGRKPLPSFDFLELNVLKTTPETTAHLTLLTDLHKCLAVYMRIESPGQSVGGRFVLKLFPSDAPLKDAPASESGWAFLSNASGNFSYGTNIQLYVGGGIEANYSDPNWRFNAYAQANYQLTEVTAPDGTTEKVEVGSFYGKVLILRSIETHWSVALMVAPQRSPNDNLAFENRAGIALGWDLIPFQGTADRTLGVRYSATQVYQDYIQETFDSKMERIFFTHGLSAYLRWHFNQPNLDLTTALSGSTKIDDFSFSSLGGSINLVFRLTSNLTLGLMADVQYRPQRISAPKPNAELSTLGQFLRGFNYSPWAVSTSLNLSYQIGQTTLYRQDNR